MSLFNIKLKTKAGNDVKKKQTFTVFFRLKYKKGLKTIAEYSYRIIHPRGIIDVGRVLELKVAKDVNSIEDLTLKVMLNFVHLIGMVSQKYSITPDFVIFVSPDLDSRKNKAWSFLSDIFYRPKAEKDKKGKLITSNPCAEINLDWLEDLSKTYEVNWTEEACKKMKIKKEELDLLKSFGDINPNTVFMNIDPNRDPIKYQRSIHICNMLQDRIDRNLQITEDLVK